MADLLEPGDLVAVVGAAPNDPEAMVAKVVLAQLLVAGGLPS